MLNRQVSGMLLDRKSFKSDAIFEKIAQQNPNETKTKISK